MNHPFYAAERIRNSYPDVYHRMVPHAYNMAANIVPHRHFSQHELHRYSSQVVHNSRIMDDPCCGHSERGLGGIAKVLLLAALLERL
jgi:glycine/serine hydroxymethyltransferase